MYMCEENKTGYVDVLVAYANGEWCENYLQTSFSLCLRTHYPLAKTEIIFSAYA